MRRVNYIKAAVYVLGLLTLMFLGIHGVELFFAWEPVEDTTHLHRSWQIFLGLLWLAGSITLFASSLYGIFEKRIWNSWVVELKPVKGDDWDYDLHLVNHGSNKTRCGLPLDNLGSYASLEKGEPFIPSPLKDFLGYCQACKDAG